MPELASVRRLQGWTALSSLGLLGVTWRLWTPQSIFPQVPVSGWLCAAPPYADWLLLAWLCIALTGLAAGSCWPQRLPQALDGYGWSSVFVSLMALVALDQHRLQPWAYELWIVALIWLCFPESTRRLGWLRLILVSLYFYSACSKFDFEFLHTVGQQLLTTVLGFIQIDAQQLPMSLRLGLATTFPLLELAIAVGLAIPGSRRWVGMFAILMHLGLILTLGPLGLNHRLGVLVWNAQVGLQVYWLFVVNPAHQDFDDSDLRPSPTPYLAWCQWRALLGRAVLTLVLLMPLTERFGLWDHWLSWALYAPHSSRLRVEVAPSAIKRLPTSLRQLLPERADDDEYVAWIPLPIDAWSLQTLDSPIYPQVRYQLGVAEDIAARIDSEFRIRATMLGPASRFTGQRNRIELDTRSEIVKAAQRFWLNTHFRRSHAVHSD